tara:strand:- start:568 stop:2436 length:1869 start_codon:yes stop_codon:yes gene_type:complete
MEKIEVEFEVKYKDALKDIEQLQKELKDVQETVVDGNKATAKSLESVEKSAGDSAKGVKKVGVSIGNLAKASGIIFLLQKAFEFVSSAIQENQQVMTALNTVMEAAQIVFNQIVTVFTDVYKSVTSATENFDALGKVVTGIVTIALTPMKLSFFAIKLALQSAQLAWEKSFFGGKDPETIKALQEGIDETKQSIADVATEAVDAGKSIVSNIGEAVSEVGAIGGQIVEGLGKVSVKTAIETAKANMALKKNAEIAEAQSRILIEQYDRQAEKLRQVRDDERASVEDRIAANDELKLVLEDQEKQMLSNANTVLAAAQAQFDLTGKNEDYVAVLNAQAEVAGVLATATGFLSEQKVNEAGLQKELIELDNAKIESASLLSIEQQKFNAEQIVNEVAKLEALKTVFELEKTQESLRLQNVIDNANVGTQAKIDAQIAYNQFMETSRQQEEANNDALKLAEEQQDKDVMNAKLDSAKQGFALVGELAGEGSKLGKAMAIGQATISGYQAVQNAFTTASLSPVTAAFPAYPFIQAGLAGAFAAVNIRKIASTKSVGGGPPPPASVGATPAAPRIPEFNTVGSSDTNQLADAIGGQAKQPIKTFVVASDVTTAQSLERNVITGATIG